MGFLPMGFLPMKKSPLVLGCCVLAAVAVCATRRSLAADDANVRPNIVWILSEDSSVHYFRLYGNELGATPQIERLAGEGIMFEHAFSCSPVCSVARTTLMSGMYAPRVGFQYHRRFQPAVLPEGAELFPAYLRQAGYYTTNNAKKDYNVEEGQVWDESSNNASWRNRPSPETPFFHMQTVTLSHESSLHFSAAAMQQERLTTDPEQVDLAPYHPDTPTFRFTKARYFDRIRAVDAEVGKIVGQLEKDKLLDDTIIFYFGDHGGVLPRSKGYLYETGLHVPLVVRVPEKWRRLVHVSPGRVTGFVNFIDFAPTVLHLAGVKVPPTMDGEPFLGPDVSDEDLGQRNEAFGYADRFDEKYDLCRSLRKGRYKYIRNYQAYYPDALHNNYRYTMLAYDEWRERRQQRKLNDVQRRFFEPKPVEALFDLESDPHEIKNLAGDPTYAEVLADLRGRLQRWVKRMPDLSFYPESHLVENALPDGAAFGKAHAEEIARLVDTADLALLPLEEAAPRLRKALTSTNRWERYWGLVACSCFGEDAQALVVDARKMRDDPEPLVRVRAAEFLALLGEDPRPTLSEVLATADAPLVSLLTLNTIVFLRDREPGFQFDVEAMRIKANAQEIERRREYLRRGKK